MTGKHSSLAPSSAGRWIACPGSVAAEASFPDDSTVYSEAGTIAHLLAAMAGERRRPARQWVGEDLYDEEHGVRLEVDQDMADAVQIWLDYTATLAGGSKQVLREQRVSLESCVPEMWGTVDFAAIHPAHLHVADLKFGTGVLVHARGNAQARAYALGVFLSRPLKERSGIRTITTHIVQPRILDVDGNPSITTETLDCDELGRWGEELRAAAHAARQDNAPRMPGDHCRFCKAKGVCPEFRGVALAAARQDFEDLAPATIHATLPGPLGLTPEQMARVLAALPLLEEWIAAVRHMAFSQVMAGQVIPGWALAPKRATRKWADEAAAVQWATTTWKLDVEDLYDRKFRSPAQVEKLIGKNRVPEDLAPAVSSGYNLVPETHPAALPPAGSDFANAVQPEPGLEDLL